MLVRVLSGFPLPFVPFSLVYPSRRHLAPRTRLVTDFIWEHVRQIHTELATVSDECARGKRRAEACSLTHRNHHSVRRFDRDIMLTSQACPLLFLVMLARNRRISVDPAHARRVSVGAGTDTRIAKTITAASRRSSLALRQGVKAAAQSAVFRDVTAAILVWARRGRRCTPKKCCAADRRGAKSKALSFSLSGICSHLLIGRLHRRD
jgi:hypothetical protein